METFKWLFRYNNNATGNPAKSLVHFFIFFINQYVIINFNFLFVNYYFKIINLIKMYRFQEMTY